MTPDIDLIPEEYRETRWRIKVLKRTGLVTVIACAALLAATAFMMSRTREASNANKAAQGRIAIAEQQRAQLEIIDGRIAGLEAQLRLLGGLRSGAVAEALFALIDDALPQGEVWLDDLRLVRAGVSVPEGATAERVGYFIVVSNPPGDGQTHVQSTLDLEGHAVDHAALSRFVRRLYAHPEVNEVRLDRTTRRNAEDDGAVGFELSITLTHVTSQPA